MSKLKNEISVLLGEQLKPSDLHLIDELEYNFSLLKKAKDGIKKDGLMINTVRDPNKTPFYQKSPYFAIYDTTLKNINQLYSKLGISPQDRRTWPVEDGNDDFDKDFD